MKMTALIILLLTIVIGSAQSVSSEVFVPCTDGVVNITGRGLTGVPTPDGETCGGTGPVSVTITHSDIDKLSEGDFRPYPRMVLLNMSHGSITSIAPRAFEGANALTDIDLSFNPLKFLYGIPFGTLLLETILLHGAGLLFVEPKVFAGDGFRNLRELDLSANELSHLPIGVLNYTIGLRKLNCSDNKLDSLLPGLFAKTSLIAVIDFSYNNIPSVPRGTFEGLESLTTVDLSNNPLAAAGPMVLRFSTTSVTVALRNCGLTTLPLLLSDSTTTGPDEAIRLDVRGNPIECDCRHVDGSVIQNDDYWRMSCEDGKNEEIISCLPPDTPTTNSPLAVVKGQIVASFPTCAEGRSNPPSADDNSKFAIVTVTLSLIIVALSVAIALICIKSRRDHGGTNTGDTMLMTVNTSDAP